MTSLENLEALLDRYNTARPQDRPAIVAEIESRFRVDKAILVLDMSGFTRTVRRLGIIHYLGMMRRMRAATEPLVARFRGEVVKYEADNLYAVFDRPDDAVDMAIASMFTFNGMNLLTDDDQDIHVCIGIARGQFLVVPHGDMYGDAVNIACKLGEDLAKAGDILVDESAFVALAEPDRFRAERTVFKISGLDLPAWQVRY